MTCPTPDDLASYAAGAFPAADAEALESHAAGCGACRNTLRLLADPRIVPDGAVRPAGKRSWPVPSLKIAAALLLAVSAGLVARTLLLRPTGPDGAAGIAPASAPARSWPQAASALPPQGWSGRGVEVTPQAGARAVLDRDAAGPLLRLEAGGAWVWASESAPLVLETPVARLRLAGAEVFACVEGSAGSPVSLLDSAHAAEGETLRVIPLQGRLRWEEGGVPREAPAGTMLRFRQGRATMAPADPAVVARCLRERLARLEALGTWRELLRQARLDADSPSVSGGGMPEGPYRLVVALTGRTGSTEVAVIVPTPAGPRQWTALLAARGAGPETRLEIRFDGAVWRARRDGVVVAEFPAEVLAQALEPGPADFRPDAWGLRSWGGSVTVSGLRVQVLP